MPVEVRQAGAADLDGLVPLFGGDWQFYRRSSDPDGARRFLEERLEKFDSTILIAENDGGPVGFTQLYPAFSSVSMRRIFILNDLYVAPAARGSGAASALLDAAVVFGRDQGAISLTLSTEYANTHAQAIYEAKSWVADTDFKTYHYRLDS